METASMILFNGKIATVDPRFSFVQAVAVRKNRIIAVGTNEQVLCYKGTDTQVIDLKRKLVLPGAFDSHMHAVFSGFMKGSNVISFNDVAVRSLEDIKELIYRKAKMRPKGSWIIGSGLDMGTIREYQEGKIQTIDRYVLDELWSDSPLWIVEFGMHEIVMNTKALEQSGLNGTIPDLPEYAGKIEQKDGVLTGVFMDWAAQNIAGEHMWHMSEAELEQGIHRIQQELVSYGITFHTDVLGIGGNHIAFGSWGEEAITAYEKLAEKHQLQARVSVQLFVAKDGIQTRERIEQGLQEMKLPVFRNPDMVRAGTIKLFGDSSAWMRGDIKGRSAFPGETKEEQRKELKQIIRMLHKNNWQIGIHAIGGEMTDMVAEIFDEVETEMPGKDLRHFIIHGDQINSRDLMLMKAHHIGLSPQPIAAEYMLDAFGDPDMFCFQTYMENGIPVAGGSDANVFSVNWLHGLQVAVTRKALSGIIYKEENGCNLEDGVRMYTINGAIQNHVEDRLGSIEVGKLADFQVLSQDIFEIPSDRIGMTTILMTICDGEIVWKKSEDVHGQTARN